MKKQRLLLFCLTLMVFCIVTAQAMAQSEQKWAQKGGGGEPSFVPVESFTLSTHELSLESGECADVTITYQPRNATYNYGLVWVDSADVEKEVAKLAGLYGKGEPNCKGARICGVKPGTAKIYAGLFLYEEELLTFDSLDLTVTSPEKVVLNWDEKPVIETDKVSKGKNVTGTVNVYSQERITELSFTFKYDSSKLEYVSYAAEEGWTVTQSKALDGIVQGSYSGSGTAYGNNVQLNFIARGNGRLSGDGFSHYGAKNANGQDVNLGVAEGTVVAADGSGNSGTINAGDLNTTDSTLPGTGFSGIRSQALSAKPLDLNYQPVSMMLEIPSLSVAADIVEVPFKDGSYPIEWLGSSVGMLEASAELANGYTVLTGHNHLNNIEAGPFALLASVEKGDRIFIHDANDEMKTYVVYANEKISETDFAAVEAIAAQFEDSITLMTCEDERVEGGYANRRIVAAKPY